MNKNISLKEFLKKKNSKVLFTPGPSSLSLENILGLDPCFGRGDLKYDLIEDFVLKKIKKISGHNKIARFQGSGSLALEMMIINFLYGKVLIIKSGYYSDRLYEMALNAKNIYGYIKKIIYVDIKEAEKISKKFDWVYSCYTETSIGMKLPIKRIKKLSKTLNSKLMLDATASIGLENYHYLADVIGFSSCKGLFGLTGGAFICYNDKPQNQVDSFYLDLETHLNKKMTGPYHTICSLYEVLKKHDDFKYSVVVNKKKFIKKYKNIINLPGNLQPLICTHVDKKLKRNNSKTIMYQSRGNTNGCVISHLGEVHLKRQSKGLILQNIK